MNEKKCIFCGITSNDIDEDVVLVDYPVEGFTYCNLCDNEMTQQARNEPF